MANAFVQDKTD